MAGGSRGGGGRRGRCGAAAAHTHQQLAHSVREVVEIEGRGEAALVLSGLLDLELARGQAVRRLVRVLERGVLLLRDDLAGLRSKQ